MVALVFLPIVFSLHCLQLKQALVVFKPQHLSVPFNDSFVFVFVIVSGNYCCAVMRLFHAICTAAEGGSLKAFFVEKQKAVVKCLFL